MADIWRSNATKLGEQLAQEQKVTTLPVRPIEIAESLGILVEPLPPGKKGVSGMLVESNNNFGIKYATYIDNIGFQNFCVGHELGHYIIPGHYEQLLTDGHHESSAGFISGDRFELEADHFSAGFLMPGYLFDNAMNKVQNGLKAVDFLSTECETSFTATAIRYAQRTPDPLAIIVSEGQVIKYCFMSAELREVKGLSWIKKGTRLSSGTVTSCFNKVEKNILNGNRSEGESTLLDWFDCSLRYELYEEVVGLGEYGKTLTVLTLDSLPDQEEVDDEDEMIESWTPRFKR